jgi:hypothetical protein
MLTFFIPKLAMRPSSSYLLKDLRGNEGTEDAAFRLVSYCSSLPINIYNPTKEKTSYKKYFKSFTLWSDYYVFPLIMDLFCDIIK